MPTVVPATRFSSSLEEAAPEAVKAALAVGQFGESMNDPRAPADTATADRLRSDMATSGVDGTALAQELPDSLSHALWEALDTVFVAASIAAALSQGFAVCFRVPVRPVPASGEAIGTDGKEQP